MKEIDLNVKKEEIASTITAPIRQVRTASNKTNIFIGKNVGVIMSHKGKLISAYRIVGSIDKLIVNKEQIDLLNAFSVDYKDEDVYNIWAKLMFLIAESLDKELHATALTGILENLCRQLYQTNQYLKDKRSS